MAEQIQKQGINPHKGEKPVWKKEEPSMVNLVRILQTDIPGNKRIYAGLTRIKGVSWALANAICVINGIDKNNKIESLNKDQIEKIEEILKKGKFPIFLINRRKDFASGEDKHLVGSDLELVKEFDIKRLKGIRSYRGLRHATGQPSRGQRTKSHFRTNRKKSVGVKSKRTRTEGSQSR
jgi:small subunit ribosomal protein S13